MSTFQRLTLIGLFNHSPDIFDLLTLPPAYDRQTFLDAVLLDQGEKCVVYSEPDFFKYAVGVWSRKWAESLERVAIALLSDYNPIHNYDRYEEWEEKDKGDYRNNVKHGGTDKTTNDGTVTTENSGTTKTTKTGTVTTANTGTDTTANTGTVTTKETGTSTEATNNMVTERTVSAFNESGYQPDEKTTVNGSVTRTPDTTETVTPNTEERFTHGKTETVTPNTTETVTPDMTETVTTDTSNTTEYGRTEDGSGDDRHEKKHVGHLFGNIGVTTNMQMIEAEVSMRQNLNMYSIAAQLFADDLLLMLY